MQNNTKEGGAKTKKFTTATAAFLKVLSGSFSGVNNDQAARNSKKVILENMAPVMEAFDDLLIDPTKDDLALMSTEASLALKVILLRRCAEERSMQPHLEKEINDMNTTFQKYLLYKAESIEGNEKLLKLINENISKAA